MEACVRGQTQNANEGLLLFGQFVQRQTSCCTTESGAAIAINRFNLSTSALGMRLTRMGLSTGKHFAKQPITIDKTQLHVAQNAAKDAKK